MPLVQLPPEPVRLANLIAGAWSTPPGATYLDVRSPYTGQVIGSVPLTPASEVERAVAAAHEAFAGWSATPIKERAQVIFKMRELLLANLERLAHSAAGEAGKTVAEGRAEFLKGIEVAEFALSLQNVDSGGVLEVSRGITCEYRREPLGVVAGVTPFNFPAMVPMWMFPIALALGNTFVWKPSEKVPLTANEIGKLMIEAGFPPGVFSIVHGGRETVEALLARPEVTAVGFVGSTPVARQVFVSGTSEGKRVLALGGAKNHLIVVPDADEALTVQAVVDSFTGCAGQRCMAASVLLAVGDVQHLIDRVVDRASRLELGTGMGAIIDRGAVSRIEAAVGAGAAAGAKLLLDGRGKRPAGDEYREGSWVGPSILDHVDPASELRHTEVFGPLLAIVRVPTLREAIEVQRSSRFGNAASIFTTNGAVAQLVAEQASAGMIGVNVGVPVPREPFSFGGTKESRFGQGDITGQGGVELWSTVKKITRKWAVQTDTTWMG